MPKGLWALSLLRRALAALSLLMSARVLAAAEDSGGTPVKVAVVATADDSAGSRLVYELREAIRASKGMMLDDESAIQIRIVTMDPLKDSADFKGRETVYSAVWTLGESPSIYFRRHKVGACPEGRLKICASDLVAETDAEIAHLREAVRQSRKSKGR